MIAAKAVAENMFSHLTNNVQIFLTEKNTEFSCLNTNNQFKTACKLITNIVSMFAGGVIAAKGIGSAARWFMPAKKGTKLTPPANAAQRAPLSPVQKEALLTRFKKDFIELRQAQNTANTMSRDIYDKKPSSIADDAANKAYSAQKTADRAAHAAKVYPERRLTRKAVAAQIRANRLNQISKRRDAEVNKAYKELDFAEATAENLARDLAKKTGLTLEEVNALAKTVKAPPLIIPPSTIPKKPLGGLAAKEAEIAKTGVLNKGAKTPPSKGPTPKTRP